MMNRFFASNSILILCLAYICGIAQEGDKWDIFNEGRGQFQTIDFINEQVGWMAGEGTLLKTEDGGNNWISIPVDENIRFEQIFFIDESAAWALDFSKPRSLIKTTDGGKNWTVKKVQKEHERFRKIQVLNESIIYMIGGKDSLGKIWKSTNSGNDWNEISPDLIHNAPHSIWFINSEVGIILCERSVFRTLDGGLKWNEYSRPSGMGENWQFINDSTGYALGDSGWIYTTSDTGSTWSQKTQHPGLVGFFVTDANKLFAVVDDSLANGYVIKKSIDSGGHWDNTYFLGSIGGLFGSRRVKIYFSNDKNGFVIVRKGGSHLLRTEDAGNNWAFTMLSYNFLNVCFVNNYLGFAGGGYVVDWHGPQYAGDIFKTQDGGKTWHVSLNVPEEVRSIFFINENTGFAIAGGSIYKTINQAADWDLIYLSDLDSTINFYDLKDIYFTDELTGWACGGFYEKESFAHGLVILETIDGGDTWNQAFKHHTPDLIYNSLTSMYFAGSTGWAVEGGGTGIIVKYTEQDKWQLDNSLTDLPLSDVFFSDENHGWISGGYYNEQDFQSIILRTNDAGETWTQNKLDKYLINDMYFADSLHGWAVGNDTTNAGMILESFDGGENWTASVEKLSAPLTALHFKDGYGWAVGGNGLILRTKDGSTWIDQRSGKTYPNTFKLSQNYPNPFNSSTMISYQLPVVSEVELSIYNILGQKVKTLVSEKQPPGSYEVQWDASPASGGQGFASGIYIYQLKADSQNQNAVFTKKLILLK